MGDRTRRSRRAWPTLEGLEGRQLLDARIISHNGEEINDKDLRHACVQRVNRRLNGTELADRQISATTADGTRITITLHGLGTLRGTQIGPDGAVSLVYDGTTADSRIVTHVRGGDRRVALTRLVDADVLAGGDDRDPIGAVNLPRFDLSPGGRIDLDGGVGRLDLGSAGRDSAITLRELSSLAGSDAIAHCDAVLVGLNPVAVRAGLVDLPAEPQIEETPAGVDLVIGRVEPGTVIDVSGRLARFAASEARGLTLRGDGPVIRVKIHRATDTDLFGNPLVHVTIPVRRDVRLNPPAGADEAPAA